MFNYVLEKLIYPFCEEIYAGYSEVRLCEDIFSENILLSPKSTTNFPTNEKLVVDLGESRIF